MTKGEPGDKSKALRETQLFAGLEGDDILILADAAVFREYGKGSVIFGEGEEAMGFFIVVSGQVKVYKVSVDGKEHVFHLFGAGEPIGEVAVFSGKRYPACAEALQDTVCCYLSREDFIRIVEARPQLALNMMATLSERLRRFTRTIEDLSLKEVSARLAKHLIDLTIKQRNNEIVVIEGSKGHLARSLGTVSETLSRTLSKMRSKGVIEVDRSKISIIDRERLEELAAGEKL